MTDTTMEETGNCLLAIENSYQPQTVTLTNCTFSDSQDSSTSYNRYIDIPSKNSNIEIDQCSFNISNSYRLYTEGRAKVTNNTFESKGNITLSLNNQSDTETVFSGNKVTGQYTRLTAHNLEELKNNHYDNFVAYFISPFNNNTIDFLTEEIDIKEPLECIDNTTCTKKAFLSFSNGDIGLDERYKDFFCGLKLENATTAIVTGLELGNIPLFLYETPAFSGSGSLLELTDCTIDNTSSRYASIKIDFTNATLTNCTVKGKDSVTGAIQLKGNLTVDNSEIKGDIRRYSSDFDANIKLKNGSKCIDVYDDSKPATLFGHNITVSENSSAGSIISDNNGTVIVSDDSTLAGYINAIPGTVILKDCTFDGNNQTYLTNINTTTLTIDNCTFKNCTNKSTYQGGGAIGIKATKVEIINETKFIDNITEHWRGGAVYINAKDVKLSNCTFSGNKNLEVNARHAGGGAVAITCGQDNVKAVISNCTFTNNSCAVENTGTDMWMSAIFTKENSDEIAEEHSGCTLEISGCNIDLSSNSVHTNNINK
ncbi:MAG: hypothetical protein HDR38_05170 [Treponema sp.]|nr:hypothetical protein [Treponema sp.]